MAYVLAAAGLTGVSCSSDGATTSQAEPLGPSDGTNTEVSAPSEQEERGDIGCSSAEPPLASAVPSTVELAGPPPEPQGGEILEGVYFKTEVRFYDGLSTQPVPSSTIRIQAGTFMQRIGEIDAPIGGRLAGSVSAGSLATSGSSASFETSACINQSPSGTRTNTVGYDASPTRLSIHRDGLVEVFDRREE